MRKKELTHLVKMHFSASGYVTLGVVRWRHKLDHNCPLWVLSKFGPVEANMCGVIANQSTVQKNYIGNRDFKIWYGEAVVRRQIVKITSGDVMSRVPLRLSRRSLAFYYGKVPSSTYSSLREFKPAVYFSF